MTKISALSLVAAMLLAVATPAIADEGANANFDEEAAIAKLDAQGISASDINVWNGKARATVQLADGSFAFQYFDADTMQPIGAVRPSTRVLTKLDVGQAGAAQPTLNSLTWEDPENAN